MEKLGVIKKCTEPTAWVNSLVVAEEKNNEIRVCMDLTDLNRAVVCEHFPIQTVEDVTSRMPSAKVFSFHDGSHGFWQGTFEILFGIASAQPTSDSDFYVSFVSELRRR